MATDRDLSKKVKSLPDLTLQVTARDMPSVLVTSPDDRRIEKLANSLKHAFFVRSDGFPAFVYVINPNKKNGFLWWKKSDRLVISSERWENLENENLSLEEKNFINEL